MDGDILQVWPSSIARQAMAVILTLRTASFLPICAWINISSIELIVGLKSLHLKNLQYVNMNVLFPSYHFYSFTKQYTSNLQVNQLAWDEKKTLYFMNLVNDEAIVLASKHDN